MHNIRVITEYLRSKENTASTNLRASAMVPAVRICLLDMISLFAKPDAK